MKRVGRVLVWTFVGAVGVILSAPSRSRVARPRKDEGPPTASVSSWSPALHARSAPRPKTSLPPVLLTMPEYHGTLAAARSLGSRGVPITTARSGHLATADWSRYTTATVRCPPVRDTERFLRWLVDFGQSHEKHVLLPTCDDVAWLFALHREELSKHFFIGPSGISAVHGLLSKRLLHAHAAEAGLLTPRSWFPESVNDLPGILEELTFPIVIKPVTQVLFETRNKGAKLNNVEELEHAYRAFGAMGHGTPLREHDASAAHPMLQEFFPQAASGIYNVSGYARSGRLCGTRAARKLLQRPRQMGIGVCFEEAPVARALVDGLERLVRNLDFTGVFEAEFIETPRGPLLIDFNPRFYNQMRFDVERGLPLPLLSYEDALGVEGGSSLLGEIMIEELEPRGRVYAHHAALDVFCAVQRLKGEAGKQEAEVWAEWAEAHRDLCIDAVEDANDPWPARLDTLLMLGDHARHPRGFLRSLQTPTAAATREA